MSSSTPTNPSTSASARSARTEAASTSTTSPTFLHTCSFLGDIYRVRMPGDDESRSSDSSSFVGHMSVPTYAARPTASAISTSLDRTRKEEEEVVSATAAATTRVRSLEGVVQPGPALVVDHFLTHQECERLLDTFERRLGFHNYRAGKNHHGALQVVVSQETCDSLRPRLVPHLDASQVERVRRDLLRATGNDVKQDDDVRLEFRGLNRRWRVYRYTPGGKERFAPHIDAGFPPSGLSDDGSELVWDASSLSEVDDNEVAEVVSRLTLLMYLNDDFDGGHTQFFEPAVLRRHSESSEDDSPTIVASVRPIAGSCLVFPQAVGEAAVEWARHHWPLHEGSPVTAGARPKYVIRSDAVFATIKPTQVPEADRALFRYDNLVRRAFLPTSPAIDAAFLRQVQTLYQPHMGVENLGPLLYSSLRFTKARHVVEIGAGYSTLWILQALADNDRELRRVQDLQREGKCRLLDWPWTNHAQVDHLLREPASLLCVDNCLHQRETATGAATVARNCGLESYLTFVRGDAFEDLTLEPGSVDVLWCDFGVGSRMREFAAKHWDSLRSGGFLLCHSTLTNRRTRDWLEAVRNHEGWDATGLPADEYSELSLLEPHKHYQNSVTLIQKRSNYSEPIYSEYA